MSYTKKEFQNMLLEMPYYQPYDLFLMVCRVEVANM